MQKIHLNPIADCLKKAPKIGLYVYFSLTGHKLQGKLYTFISVELLRVKPH